MNDDKPREPFVSARPANRGTRREPATIDARADDVTPKVEPTPVEADPVPQDTPAAAEAVVAQAAEQAAEQAPAPESETLASAHVDPEPSRTLEGPPASTLPPGGGSGFLRLAAASVVGAAVALGAAAGIQKLNAPAQPDTQPLTALESRLGTAEAKLGAAEAKLGEMPTAASVSALEKRIAAAEASAKEALAKASTPPQPALQSAPSVDTAAIARLEQRLTALEKAPAAPPAAGPAPRPGTPAAAVPPDLDKRLAALETALTAQKSTERATETRIEAIAATPPVDIKPLEARVAAVEQRLQPLQATVASTSDALKNTSARAETDAARANAAALAVAAQALAQAIDRGAPLQPQIESLARLGIARDKTAALEPFAAKGAVSLHDLARQFTALERKLLETETPKADAGLMDRLSQATQKLLRARPAGDTTGTTPPDLVARIQAALSSGNLPAAIAAWDMLPPAAKATSADWAAAAKARQSADAAAQAILADALAGISRSKT